MSMPPLEIIFDILATVVFFAYWGVSFIILYHLTRFGIGVQPKRFAVVFFFGSVALSCIAILLFTTIDINSFAPLIPR